MIKQFLLAITIGIATLSVNGRNLVSDASTVAQTTSGPIQGFKNDGIYTFLGVPYAHADRFMPPVDPKNHQDTLKCRIYGPKAPQKSNNQTLTFDGIRQSDNDFGFQFVLEPMDEENCLVLNLWTPKINDGKKRPVFVWIHGGGFSTGSGHDLPCYEGRALAEKGDIVVVTVNHRLNTLGYFDMSPLGGRYSDSANLGMQDLVKALEWVNQNIENFGGDPESVTIGGQSGGGGKVSTLMMMPAAKGLFHRAIVQSGSFARQTPNVYGRLYCQAMLDNLGLKADDYEGLKAVSYNRLCEASRIATATVNGFLSSQGKEVARGMQMPVLDGKHVVGPGFENGEAPLVSAEVPMIIGWNYNEFGGKGKPDRMFGDGAIAQARNKAAQGKAPVYLYMFAWEPEGNSLGACHGMELPFMFNNISLQPEMTGATNEAYNLADKMSSAWISFIRTGKPDTKGLPHWKAFEAETEPTMIFDNKPYLRTK